MPPLKDITGQRFGRLIVLNRSTPRRWKCLCDCGASADVFGCNLKSANTTSCGCLRREASADRMTVHGNARTKAATLEYQQWSSMRQRCNDPGSRSYERYGGRGITICERWDSFEAFLADMGPRPTREHQIERVDNSGPYSPQNCRWATPTEQANNRRSNHCLTFDGRTMTIADWSRATGLTQSAIEQRLRVLGWTVERALTTPLRISSRHRSK